MARLSKEELARFSGAEWGVRLCEERGTEGARKELERRGVLGIPLGVKQIDIDNWCEEKKANTIATVEMVAAVTLQDEFDMTKEDIEQFMARFEQKTETLMYGTASWEDLKEQLREELGIVKGEEEIFYQNLRRCG